MPEEIRQSEPTPSPQPLSPSEGRGAGVRYERSDASMGWVLGIVAGTLVFGLLTIWLMVLFFRQCEDSLTKSRRSRFPLALTPAERLPSEPRLEQVNRLAEISASNVRFRQQSKLETLRSYGPTAEKGYIHIPIDRAMRLLAGKLPARNPIHVGRGVTMASALGALASTAQGPIITASALFPGREQMQAGELDRGAFGLVDSGESNSGRLFNRRKPRWFGR